MRAGCLRKEPQSPGNRAQSPATLTIRDHPEAGAEGNSFSFDNTINGVPWPVNGGPSTAGQAHSSSLLRFRCALRQRGHPRRRKHIRALAAGNTAVTDVVGAGQQRVCVSEIRVTAHAAPSLPGYAVHPPARERDSCHAAAVDFSTADRIRKRPHGNSYKSSRHRGYNSATARRPGKAPSRRSRPLSRDAIASEPRAEEAWQNHLSD